MPKTDVRFDPAGYALVADRIALFYQRYPTGRIVTRLHSRTERGGSAEVTFRALVYRAAEDRLPAATGWASEREGDGEVNAVACLENAETSAVGRALANLGFAASVKRMIGREAGGANAPGPERAWLELRRAGAVREGPGPSGSRAAARRPDATDEALQRRAEVVRDLLTLVDRAEAAGLRPVRAEALRARLIDDTPPGRQLERLERVLRGWLRRHAP